MNSDEYLDKINFGVLPKYDYRSALLSSIKSKLIERVEAKIGKKIAYISWRNLLTHFGPEYSNLNQMSDHELSVLAAKVHNL
jgi:hypothetical protein